MKCIKCIKLAKGYDLDEVRRLSDEDADEKVKGGYWKFVPTIVNIKSIIVRV